MTLVEDACAARDTEFGEPLPKNRVVTVVAVEDLAQVRGRAFLHEKLTNRFLEELLLMEITVLFPFSLSLEGISRKDSVKRARDAPAISWLPTCDDDALD